MNDDNKKKIFLMPLLPKNIVFTNGMECERGKQDFSNKVIVLNATHAYIIGHYNPSVSIIDLVFHTTYVIYVNFIHQWRELQFKVDSERQIV